MVRMGERKTKEKGKGLGKGRGRGRGPAGEGGFRRERREEIGPARFRRKVCRFCEEKVDVVDYKDLKRIERLVSERGKILSRRITGTCARHQRKVEEAVKRARIIALLPFLKS